MENLVLASFFIAFIGLAAFEAVRPGRSFTKMRWWRLKGVAWLAVSYATALGAGLLLGKLVGAYSPYDASWLGLAGGALVGALLIDLFQYIWHRAIHAVPLLWRFHQTHHSAERIDVWSSLIFHPIDIAMFTIVGSAALVLFVGIPAEAAVLAVGIMDFLSLFQHTNIKTPRWLGYLVQRPENHTLHHARDRHRSNYGGLSIWDMVFGTFENPEAYTGKTGFYDGASNEIGALLLARDVSSPEVVAAVERDAIPPRSLRAA